MPRSNLIEYFDDFRRKGAAYAYVHKRGYRTERWTYQEVYDRAIELDGQLQRKGVVKGDRVLLWGENCAEWVVAFFACLRRGAIVVPIDDKALVEFALRVGKQVSARIALCSRHHAVHFAERASIALEDLGKASQSSGHEQVAEAPSPSDPVQIVFTSGTTAEPAGVVITHDNVVANIGPLEEEIRKYLKYERWVHPIRFLNLLPMSHVFGQFLSLYLPPLMTGTVVFQNTLNPSEVMQTIRRERVSVLVAVPRMLQSLMERMNAEAGMPPDEWKRRISQLAGRHFLRRWWTFRKFHRLLGWKFWAMISGGAALDTETEAYFQGLGFAVVQGYGLTETTSLISVNHPFRIGKGSIGKILPGREIKLADDGEILVRGGGVASARWGAHGLAPLAGQEGWYRTGDVGSLDAEGNLYFKGRKKDVIVSAAGMNIYPADLEAALRAQPEVRDCIVIGIDRDGNAEPCAVLLLRGRPETADEIVTRTNRSLAEYQQIRVWHVWPEQDFPRTSTQKPRRAAIEQAVRQHLSSSPTLMTTGAVEELVARISDGNGKQAAGSRQPSSALQLTSLERVELLSALEDRYQVDLSETQFATANNISDIQSLLQGAQPKSIPYHYPRWTLRWPVTWIRTAAYHLLIRPAMVILGSPTIIGRENVADVHSPLLVVSNHIDHVDVGFITTALPARLRHRLATAAGGETLEMLRTPSPHRGLYPALLDRIEWILGVALLNLFPLPREAGFRKSFAYAGEAVDRGYSVLVFPEGRHTTDGRMNPFRTGIGLLANNLRIPVLPMRIDGLYEVKVSGKRCARPGQIQVRIGKPIQFEVNTQPEEIASRLQRLVQGL